MATTGIDPLTESKEVPQGVRRALRRFLGPREFTVVRFSGRVASAFGVGYTWLRPRSREGISDGFLYNRRDFRKRVRAGIRSLRAAIQKRERANRAHWSSRSGSREARWHRRRGRLILEVLREYLHAVREVRLLGFDGIGIPRPSCRECGVNLPGRGPRKHCAEHKAESKRLWQSQFRARSKMVHTRSEEIKRRDAAYDEKMEEVLLTHGGEGALTPHPIGRTSGGLGMSNLREHPRRKKDGKEDFEREAEVVRKELRRFRLREA